MVFAAILVFTALLNWYVIFDILLDGIYEIITHEWLLFWKTTNLHSNICQNLFFFLAAILFFVDISKYSMLTESQQLIP